MEFYADRAALDIWLGTYFFFLGWAGTGIWETTVLVDSPARIATNRPSPSRPVQLMRRLLLGEQTVYLEGIPLTADEFLARTRHLGGQRPYFIRTTPSYAAHLVAQLLAHGSALPRPPRAVICHGETLTAANVAAIEQAFRCPVVNQYSGWDVPQMAQSCPDNPSLLHVNSERVVIRVVRDDGQPAAPGEIGRVVVTDLANYVMPFISYEIGDQAIAGGRCPCGRGFPTLASIEGRNAELIRTPDGRAMASGILSHVLVSGSGVIPYVWEYQAVQESLSEVLLRIVPTPRFTPAFAQQVQTDLQRLLGPSIRVRVETVDQIPWEPNGKRLIIKSTLA
jgi:phenylacetate-CoA ligase